MDTYYNFIRTGDKNAIETWFNQLDALYAVGKAGISDEVYDRLLRLYEERFGKRTVVGSAPIHNVVKLPIAMMSLDKIMDKKELATYMSKNPQPYVVMDKINGNAGLYEIKLVHGNPVLRLYNRGDGMEGTDLTYMLPYLKLPVLRFDVLVKGELVINKADYEPYKDEYKSNLAMINGLLNSKSADPAKLKLFKFIAYDMVFPANREIELKMSDTLQYLSKYGFTIPFAVLVNDLSIDWLSDSFKYRKRVATYDVDGLVIVADKPITYDERLIYKNPSYAVAFKEYGETAIATVVEVVWKDSKNSYIKPRIKTEPIILNNLTIKSFTGFNAGWVRDNKVGPGTKLLVTHNTIPYIMGVVESTYAQLPPNPESWKWNDTGVDIILLIDTDEVKIAKIHNFFRQVGAKYLGEATIAKLYYAGFDSIKKLLEATKNDILSRQIEGIGGAIIDRMMTSIAEVLPLATLAQLMSASGQFGDGFGTRKLAAITLVYPNILSMTPSPTVHDISQIEGFGEKSATRFVERLPKFKQFIAEIPILQDVLAKKRPIVSRGMSPKLASPVVRMASPLERKEEIQETPQRIIPLAMAREVLEKKGGETLEGKIVVFTGFRDKSLEEEIRAMKGKVTTNVSKKTNYVIVGGKKGVGSAKEKKAIEYGIPIYNVEEFRTKFALY